ncbi:MAG: type I-A CRISPR-associated protein Csa5 [Infirmifilum sp.]
MSEKTQIRNLARVLAILNVEQGSYHYIDKISQTVSRSLAMYYIREALRDYASLTQRGFETKAAREAAQYVNFLELEKEIEMIRSMEDVSALREELSAIAAQALAEAGKIRYFEARKEGTGEVQAVSG